VYKTVSHIEMHLGYMAKGNFGAGKLMKFYSFYLEDYLRNEEDIARYWRLAQKDYGDDTAFALEALATIARARNINALAKQAGISRQGLYKALSSNGNPRYETVAKLAKALGLKLTLRPAKSADKAA